MKKTRVFKSLFFFSVICIVAGLSVLHSCKEDVEPFYISDVQYFVKVKVVDIGTKANLSGVKASITYPNKTQKTTTISDTILPIDMSNREDGQLILQFDKEDYISISDTITIDRTGVAVGSTCEFLTTVMLTKISDKIITVNPGVEMTIKVSDVSVTFPENCLTTSADITITELSLTEEIDNESGEFELTDGRYVLKSIVFLPEGLQFEEPIEVTFSIPDTDKDLEFANFVDDDKDGIGVWESVPVVDNGDGTGTVKISHLSNWILCTTDRWKIYNSGFSDFFEFTGDCDDDLEVIFQKSYDSDGTIAEDDLVLPIQLNLSETKIVAGHTGYKKSIAYRYTISTLENVIEGYSIEIPSFPVVWEPSSEQTCHTGGAGN